MNSLRLIHEGCSYQHERCFCAFFTLGGNTRTSRFGWFDLDDWTYVPIETPWYYCMSPSGKVNVISLYWHFLGRRLDLRLYGRLSHGGDVDGQSTYSHDSHVMSPWFIEILCHRLHPVRHSDHHSTCCGSESYDGKTGTLVVDSCHGSTAIWVQLFFFMHSVKEGECTLECHGAYLRITDYDDHRDWFDLDYA